MEGLILGAICLYTHSAFIWVAWKELREFFLLWLVCVLHREDYSSVKEVLSAVACVCTSQRGQQ